MTMIARTILAACALALALPLQAQMTLEPLPIKPDYHKIALLGSPPGHHGW